MALSGWCSGPPGARPHCGECVSLICDHVCHADQTCTACLAPVLSDTHHETCVAPLDLLCGESRSTEGLSMPEHGKMGAKYNGPERGVCTSGRGLIDANEERQL